MTDKVWKVVINYHRVGIGMARMLRTLQKKVSNSSYTFKLSNPAHWNLCVILYWYACKYLRS